MPTCLIAETYCTAVEGLCGDCRNCIWSAMFQMHFEMFASIYITNLILHQYHQLFQHMQNVFADVIRK